MIEPETGKLALEPRDVFLLCSDGLSDGLWDREIAKNLKPATENQTPAAVARALVALANAASGKDNITAVVACAEGSAAPPLAGNSGGRLRAVLGWFGLGEKIN